MIRPRVPKIFSSRKAPPRQAVVEDYDEEGSVYSQPSPANEHAMHAVAFEEPLAVPPPLDYAARDPHDDHVPRSRLFESFSDDGQSRQHEVRDVHDYRGHDYVAHGERPGDYDYELADARPVQFERSRPVQIPPSSERSHSSRNRVTFLGDLNHNDSDYDSLDRAMSSGSPGTARSDSLRTTSSGSYRRNYDTSRRGHDYQRDQYIEQQLPYMILVDFGDGLKVGNEVDGFMPYEEYAATAHLRRNKDAMDTYFIIPGSTPVIFHDEDGNELYRVDARKYHTPAMRRRRYIIQDEFGNELHRIGFERNRDRVRGMNDFESNGSRSLDGGSSGYGSGIPSPRSRNDRVIYMESNGRQAQSRLHSVSSRSESSRSANSRLSESSRTFSDSAKTTSSKSSNPDILVMDEHGRRIYDSRDSDPNYSRSYRRQERQAEDRPNYVFVDEEGRPVAKESFYPGEFGSSKRREIERNHSSPIIYL